MKIAVIGSGGWGMAMAGLLRGKGHDVALWSYSLAESALLRETGANERLLPGVTMPAGIVYTTDLACAEGCPLVVIAVPSFGVARVCAGLRSHLHPGQTAVLLSKGFDPENGWCLLGETLSRTFGRDVHIVALTGPSHAEEVARGVPTAVLAASRSRAAAELVRQTATTDFFRVYTSGDIVSAELGGAMKNLYALAVGISDGAGFGDNTKAMLMTRGISEMSRLGVLLGGRRETFAGLSGVGDLIVTCVSMHSRNRRAGLLIGGGATAEEAMKQVGATVEGYYATRAVHELTAGRDVELPICEAMYEVLFRGLPVRTAAEQLLSRTRSPELDADPWR